MSKAYRIIVLSAMFVACVGCDQATKIFAGMMLDSAQPVTFLQDAIILQYTHNPGAFLSLGADLPPTVRATAFVGLVAVMLLFMLAYILYTRNVSRLELYAVALVVGGGAGNMIDRIRFGYVRDFANLAIGPLRTGIFNFADMAIMAGFALLLIHIIKSRKEGITDDRTV